MLVLAVCLVTLVPVLYWTSGQK